MADNKQYISHANEFGQIYISEDVISSIAYQALADVEGFGGLTARTNAEFVAPLNAKNWHKGIHIHINEKGRLMLEVNILVKYGANILEVGQNIQNILTQTIGSTTGLYPKRVHVNICGVVRAEG